MWAPVGRAMAVVRAQSTDEVQTVVRAYLEHGVPLVARGAGTGLSGGANAVEGGVINRRVYVSMPVRLGVALPAYDHARRAWASR
ncbi:FAD-binding protein [Streptomyces mesophilus]|uniref:FAD-binding protein n=1 Tax=Streptomyces mesophilus TaxID=1775132 RepID=UPI002E2CFA5E|nr:FAD-binding protein [Streptomyces mesophilus]